MFRLPPAFKTSWNNFTARAVGNRVYLRPPTESFEGFLVGHLRWQMGESWCAAAAARPPGARHRLADWFEAWRSAQPPPGTLPGATFRFRPSGAVRDLVGLADDVCRVCHAGGLPKSLKTRLKHREQFQGARYELAVAGCLARLGFTLDWHSERSTKHCEFTARHPSGEVIAVETKSRHRPGVLHVAPTSTAKPQRADVEGLYREAIAQNPNDRPFAIFLDVNLPPEPERVAFDKTWVQDVRAMLDKLPAPSPCAPDPHALLCVTNLGGYWEQDVLASPPEVLVILSQHARAPLKDVRMFDALRTTLGRYGAADEG